MTVDYIALLAVGVAATANASYHAIHLLGINTDYMYI